MNNRLFSIILPVRNGGEYVKACVKSILAQSYPHFNLLVLDNCSTDGTGAWLQSLKDERIQLFPSDRSLSIQENWARIVALPKHEFMTCIGHDDILLPDYLTTMNALINQYPAATLYQTHFNFIDARGEVLRACKPMDAWQTATAFLSSILTMTIDVNGTGFMTRSSDYDAVGGIPSFPNLIFADFALWLNLTRRGGKATSEKSCFQYRLHQSMTTRTAAPEFAGAFSVFMDYLATLAEQDKELQRVINAHIIALLSFYCRSFSHKLLRTPLKDRANITVKDWTNRCKEWADRFAKEQRFDPSRVPGVSIAKAIDSTAISRQLFLVFKKLYSRPVWNDHAR
ncbi:MAG TPA: glycosyltransferase family A protein [Chitinophagaceae bacterium]|nr:glycosyltransferase family A protein [Chitinophagaceae bacterium]